MAWRPEPGAAFIEACCLTGSFISSILFPLSVLFPYA